MIVQELRLAIVAIALVLSASSAPAQAFTSGATAPAQVLVSDPATPLPVALPGLNVRDFGPTRQVSQSAGSTPLPVALPGLNVRDFGPTRIVIQTPAPGNNPVPSGLNPRDFGR